MQQAYKASQQRVINATQQLRGAEGDLNEARAANMKLQKQLDEQNTRYKVLLDNVGY